MNYRSFMGAVAKKFVIKYYFYEVNYWIIN